MIKQPRERQDDTSLVFVMFTAELFSLKFQHTSAIPRTLDASPFPTPSKKTHCLGLKYISPRLHRFTQEGKMEEEEDP